MKDNIKRSLVKTISWRLVGSSATLLIAFLITGSLGASGTIAILQLITNTLLYFIHERVWDKVVWGRE